MIPWYEGAMKLVSCISSYIYWSVRLSLLNAFFEIYFIVLIFASEAYLEPSQT